MKLRATGLGLGLAWGLVAGLAADAGLSEVVAGPLGAPLAATPSPTPTPAAAAAALAGEALPLSAAAAAPQSPAALAVGVPPAWRLRLPGKSPLILPQLKDGPDGLWPVLQAAHFSGLGVGWSRSTHLLELSRTAALVGRLNLGDPWLFIAGAPGKRVALAGPLRLAQGAPSLDLASLKAVLAALCDPAPAWEAPTPEEALAAAALVRPVTGTADLVLVPTLEPQLAPTAAPTAPSNPGSHVAARPVEKGRVIRTIVVDAGHGGHDPGAHGAHGLREKDVCLDIARRLRAELQRRDPQLMVVMTRDKDEFISLRERTDIANNPNLNADLFVSIHNNASPNRSSRGSQVFFFDSQTSDRAAADLVSRENDETNQLDVLMTDLGKTLVRDQSIGMAKGVMDALGHALRLKHRDLSYAPFYVLARTKMPAVLVEVAFITNPSEEKLLGDPAFREKAAENIAAGLLEYRASQKGGE